MNRCPYTHSINEVEYEINDQSDSISNILILFNEQHQNHKNISEVLLMNTLPSEFNPLTYKTMECPIASSNLCKLDVKLCLNYHNENERRRVNVFYTPQPCLNVYQINNNQWLSPTICPQGDKCLMCHNKYEYMYHKDIFRKKACPYELKMNQHCNYLLTCPFKHKHDAIEDNIICNKEVIGMYYMKEITDYKSKQIEIKKILQMLLQRYQCPECSKDLTSERRVAKINSNDDRESKMICEDCAIHYHNKDDNKSQNNHFTLIQLNLIELNK